MFYYLSSYLKDTLFFANVFHYTSVRAIAALLTALFFSLLWGGWFIDSWATYFRSKAREFTPETHKAKDNMPTMGGILILVTVLATCLFWADFRNPLVGIFLIRNLWLWGHWLLG